MEFVEHNRVRCFGLKFATNMFYQILLQNLRYKFILYSFWKDFITAIFKILFQFLANEPIINVDKETSFSFFFIFHLFFQALRHEDIECDMRVYNKAIKIDGSE